MNRKISTLWVILGFLSSLTLAQGWRGGEAIALQVNDAKGRPVPDARVALTFQGIQGELGPDIVATDAKGRAVIAELKPGPWQVEVVHPEYLSFIAMVDVRRGKKPLISASFLEAGGRSLNPLKVKISKGDERQASPVLEARATPAEPEATVVQTESPPPVQVAQTPAPPTETREPSPEPAEAVELEESESPAASPAVPMAAQEVVEEVAPAESRPALEPGQQDEVAPGVEAVPAAAVAAVTAQAPEPEAEPTAAAPVTPTEAAATESEGTSISPPAPAPAPIEPVEDMDQPVARQPTEVPLTEVEPEAVELPVPSQVDAPAAAEVIEEVSEIDEPPVQPEPAPERVAEPVAEPSGAIPEAILTAPPAVAVAALPAPADPGLRITSNADGSCADCATAEWTLQVSTAVPAASSDSNGSCDPAILETARPAMRELASSIQLELQGFIGPIGNGSAQEAIRLAENDIAAPFQGPLAAFVGGTSPCQIVGLVLPREVRFSKVTYAASDQQGSGSCTPGQECTIGEAAWLGSARVERGPSSTVVYGLFENRSRERGRRAYMTAYYRPPNARWEPRLPAGE